MMLRLIVIATGKLFMAQKPLFLVPAMLALAVLLGGCGSDGDEREDNTITAQELYEGAKQSMVNGSYDRAIFQYRQMQSRFPFGRYAEQAQLELAYSYYKNFEPELSVTTLDRFLRTYPTHEHADYAHYLKGLVNFSRNRGLLGRLLNVDSSQRDLEFARASFTAFGELIQRYPNSQYADDARERMLFLRNEMAGYEIAVADYYLRRRAYVAAANRAKYVVENFQEAPQSADALAIMSQAYEQLEMTQLAEDAYRVLRINYPEHSYITGRGEEKGWLARLWPFD
ncbi:MAG: outer membrane protein assembly factor BamD [Pseudomonadota bacterium]